jgi:enolase
MTAVIKSLEAYTEFDSNGSTTLAGSLLLDNGLRVTSSIANHLSDKPEVTFLSTEKAIKYVNELLSPKLKGVNCLDYKKIEIWLDKIDTSPNKQIIGINTTLLVSKLIYKAGALLSGKSLYHYLNDIYSQNWQATELKKIPIPVFTLISGASHGSLSLNFQEFAIVFSSNLSYREALDRGAALHRDLDKVFHYRNIFSGVGLDGAYVPNLSSNFDALEIIKEAVLKNGYKIGLDIFFALDIAARYFYKAGRYYISEEVGNADTKHLVELYEKIFKDYRFLILEDPFMETDNSGWTQAMEKFGSKAYIVGDDLISTNSDKLKKAVKDSLCSTVNCKITLQPTIWKLMDFIALARKQSFKVILSQSAIETNDDFISDLAVAVQTDFVKFGPPIRGERVAKHNRLLYIENELMKKQ